MKKLIFIFVFFLLGNIIYSQPREIPPEILGWSRDGKVGIIEKRFPTGPFTDINRAFVLDTITNTVVWERTITDFEYMNMNDFRVDQEAYLNGLNSFFNDFRRICIEQFAIEISETPAVRNAASRIYNISIETIRESEWAIIDSYSVIAERRGNRRIIYTKNNPYCLIASISRYIISPSGKSALIVIVELMSPHSYNHVFIGLAM